MECKGLLSASNSGALVSRSTPVSAQRSGEIIVDYSGFSRPRRVIRPCMTDVPMVRDLEGAGVRCCRTLAPFAQTGCHTLSDGTRLIDAAMNLLLANLELLLRVDIHANPAWLNFLGFGDVK